MKRTVKLFVHPKLQRLYRLKFGNGWLILSNILLGRWLFIHVGIKVKRYVMIRVKINYRQISNIRRALVGNTLGDHSDVVGASPAGAAPTTSYSQLNARRQWIWLRQLQDETRNI